MADSVCSRSPGLSRAGSTGLPEGYASSLSFQLVRALADMQNLDIQTQAGDQVSRSKRQPYVPTSLHVARGALLLR